MAVPANVGAREQKAGRSSKTGRARPWDTPDRIPLIPDQAVDRGRLTAALEEAVSRPVTLVAAAAGGNAPDLIQDLAPLDGSALFGTVIGVAVGVDRDPSRLPIRDVGRWLGGITHFGHGEYNWRLPAAPGGPVCALDHGDLAVPAIPHRGRVPRRVERDLWTAEVLSAL